jgi:hypothetical protein
LFVANLVGQGLGPLLVGATTEHVFGDPAQVGNSLALVIPCAAVAGAVLLIVGLRSFGTALVTSEQAQSAHARASVQAAGMKEPSHLRARV